MDRKRSNNIFLSLQVLLFLVQEASCFRGHFSRRADLKLNFNPLEYFSGRFTVYDCTALCGSSDKCKSVGYELANKACHIYEVNSKDNGANETEVKGYDLYERISMSYFTRISNHHLPVQKRLELTTTDLEECAWRCISESRFDCYGFNHLRTPSTCFLINASPVEGSLPAIYSDTMDFYERTIDYGPMNNFLNFGSGMLWPFGGKVFYNHTFRGISVEQCAQRCLDERKFRCASFDYLHDKDLNFCLLSDTSVMAGHANLSNVTLANCNHFERIDTHLGMFHPILYASSLVKKVKQTSNASPEDCAKQCIDEREFVCRSFDYQVEGGGTCLFSYESTSNEESVVVRKDDKIAAHHFDLMPVYVCGENLTLPGKSLFSPGWPLKYAPNEECIWHISASSNQIITIDFFHLELGDGGKCDANSGDRLLITDFTPEGQSSRPICLPSKTTKYVTKSNKVVLRFVSDGENEDLGFRASYTADWTCNAVLKRSPGEIASSGYPLRSYPPRSSCTWRLWSSNPKHRIRLDFLYFRLQEHPLGHCTENADHIKVIDGGKVQSPTIGIYCGVMPPFFVISAGKELLVQFRADSEWKDSPDDRKKGFRASYSFEEEMGLNRTIFDRTKDVHPPRADYSFWEEMEEEDDGSKFKFAMWSMVAILALVSIILSVSLLLLARYHRKQMMKYEGSFNWPWKTEIVSMKLLKSLKRMRKQDGDLNSNNLILNNSESSHEVGASREDCSNSTQRDSSPPPSKFSRSSSKYKRLNDNNIYLGDAQNFLRSDFH